MCSRRAVRSIYITKRYFSDCGNEKKPKKVSVAIIGASGGIGQPLSLLLKLNPNISALRLHDLVKTPGVAADLSHIETATKVTHSIGRDKMKDALCGGVDIVVVPAGKPRQPGMTRDDLFKENAQIAFDVATTVAEHTPHSVVLIITNPVNSLVPIVCTVLDAAGKLCPGKVLGVTTLDSVRSATFLAELLNADPKDVTVPLVGGHSDKTILPIISRAKPKTCNLDEEKVKKLMKRIQTAGTEVVKAKEGTGSATLSTAYSASRLTFSIIRAMAGEKNIVESAYIKSDVYPELGYLVTPFILGKQGVEKNLGLGEMNDIEAKFFCESVKNVLKKDIAAGVKFAKEHLCKKKC